MRDNVNESKATLRRAAPRLVLNAALVVALAASAPGRAADVEGVYTLTKDGRAHSVATVTVEGSDYLFLADVVHALGGNVLGRSGEASIAIGFGRSRVVVTPGTNQAMVDGEPMTFSRAPVQTDSGRLYVPPDFITSVLAHALDRSVRWKGEVGEAGSILDPVVEAQGIIRADIQVRSLGDYTRILFRFPSTSVLPYTINAPPGRIVLRLQADNIDASAEQVVGDGAVQRVSFERNSGRGTFTVEVGADYRDHQTSVLRDPFRVVVDVYRRRPYTGPAVSEERTSPQPSPVLTAPPPAVGVASDSRPPAAEPTPALGADAARAALDSDLLAAAQPVSPAESLPPRPEDALAGRRANARFTTVVIDPGHGGNESGAKGPTSLLEKEVTLDLANKLKRMLERNLGVRVVLTRASDSFLALDDRTGIANNEKADLFLSIHVNASLRPNARGAETYFLSSSATDDEWRTSLARENGVIDETHGLAGTDLELILWSLAQNQFHRESQTLAEIIQGELNTSLGVRDRGVKQAPFRVLLGATMPAVLVEVGFITNPVEEKLLRDDEYLAKLVDALYRSVRRFKQAYDSPRMGVLSSEP